MAKTTIYKFSILTGSELGLGAFLPIFTSRKVCLGREFFTPDFEKKKIDFCFLSREDKSEKKQRVSCSNQGWLCFFGEARRGFL